MPERKTHGDVLADWGSCMPTIELRTFSQKHAQIMASTIITVLDHKIICKYVAFG